MGIPQFLIKQFPFALSLLAAFPLLESASLLGQELGKTVLLQVSNADKFAASVLRVFLGCQLEKAVDELNLSKKIISCHPSSLPLPDHVDRFVALNRSPSRLEFSEALLGSHTTFDGSMILFENVIQVLHRPSLSVVVA